MTSIYLVPTDAFSPASATWSCGPSRLQARRAPDWREVIIRDTDAPFGVSRDVFDLPGYPSQAHAIAHARARARREAELRAQAEREHAAYWEEVQRRRLHEERVRRQRQLEAQRREYLRRLELAQAYEARRREAEEYQRRRRAAIQRARAESYREEQQLEQFLSHFLASAFEDLFAQPTATEAGPSTVKAPAPKQDDVPVEATRESTPEHVPSQQAANGADAEAEIEVEVPSSAEPEDSTPTSKETEDDTIVPSNSDAEVPIESTALIDRPSSPTPSNHSAASSASSSRSSSRGRSRRPHVRDVDENGEEIVLPEDTADDDGDFVEVHHV